MHYVYGIIANLYSIFGNVTFHPVLLWRNRCNPNVGLTARQRTREQKYWQIINLGCAIYVSRYSTAIYVSRHATGASKRGRDGSVPINIGCAI